VKGAERENLIGACSQRQWQSVRFYTHPLYTCSSTAGIPPPLRMSRPQIVLDTIVVFHTHPFLPHFPSALSVPFPFLLCCPWCENNLCACSSPAGVRRCRCHCSLCTCTSTVSARRCFCLHIVYSWSWSAGARTFCCCCSLCTCSLHRWCLQMLPPPHSLHFLLSCWCSQKLPLTQSLHALLWCWCSQRPLPQSFHLLLTRWCSQRPLPPWSLHILFRRWCRQGRSLGASRLQKDVIQELWPGLMHHLGWNNALCACCAFLVALWGACPALYFCLHQQPPSNPCDLTSYFCVASTWRQSVQSVWCFHSRKVPLPLCFVLLDLTVTFLNF